MQAEQNDPKALGRLTELDGFRALSILAVLSAHMLPMGPSAWKLNGWSGFAGMSIFFALSGFLICRFLWERQDVKIFFIRRIARIAPLVLLVSAIYCLLVDQNVPGFVIINLYLQNYLVSALTLSTSPLWSLAVEMHFYIAIGLAVLVFGRRGFWLLPIAAVLVLAFRIEGSVFGNINTHLRVDEILAGGMLALAWLNRDRPGVAPVMALLPKLFWPILALWALSCWPPAGPVGYARGYLAAMLIGSVLGMENQWQNRFLSTRFFAYIAAISFALYVWHSPFRHYWFGSGTDLEKYLIKRPIAFLCIFVISHISTFYYEKWFTDAARRLGRRSAAPPRAPN